MLPPVRVGRVVAIGLGVLLGIGVAGHCSGDQPRRDAVAAARAELGVELEAGRLDAGEVELFVVQAGPPGGAPVVLLHGFPEFWYAWKGAIAPLAQAGYRVIVPDQRGYGDSDKPRDVAAYRVDRLGDDVVGLLDALGHERAFVVAHDWGGGVAWNVALRHPGRVRALAVLDTPHPDVELVLPQSGEDTISWYRTFFQIPWLPEQVARWGNWRLTADALRDTARPGAFPETKLDLYRSAWDRDGAYGTMVNWYRAAYRFADERREPRRVAVPTLILVAAHDAFIPADLTRASAKLCDAGRVVELGTGTHWIAQEEPERLVAELLPFFASAR
jgi:pimeloyl-ACP methyl ester carboxylesterase